MNNGTMISIAVCCLSAALLVYSILRAWSDDLIKRERSLAKMKNEGLFAHQQAVGQNFILCDLWRLSHIYAFAKDIGVVLDHTDCLAVIAMVKRDFIPSHGVSRRVIVNAIRAYVSHKEKEDKILAEQL